MCVILCSVLIVQYPASWSRGLDRLRLGLTSAKPSGFAYPEEEEGEREGVKPEVVLGSPGIAS